MSEDFDYAIGHNLILRKPHPCGGYSWTVYRIGADIGLRCDSCSRRLVLPRSKVQKMAKSYVINEDILE